MTSKIRLYSAIFGGYDRPKPVPADCFELQPVMFTDDSELFAPGWDVQVRCPPGGDRWSPMMKHKWFKLHPHLSLPDADISIWLDGSMTIIVNNFGQRNLEALGDDDWAMVRHPVRNCIYDEAAFSATLPRYDRQALLDQVDFYRSIGHPAQWGLHATGHNIRRHNAAVGKICSQWWFENETRSHQDQLSLPVLLRLAGDDLRWNYNLPWFEWWHLSEHGY